MAAPERRRTPRASLLAGPILGIALTLAPVLGSAQSGSRDSAQRGSRDGPDPGVADTIPPAPDTTTHVLPPITVTVTREEAEPPPVTVLRVNADRLREAQASDPYDAVRRATGIEVHDQGQGPGFASNVVVRGFTSDHSTDVLLTVDGVPLNYPVSGHSEGYSDWHILLPAGVSEMRLIYGPSSPLYGDFALAGVVEVFTPHDADATQVSLSGSSWSDLNGWVRTGLRREQGGLFAAGAVDRDQGWRDNADVWLGNALLRSWRAWGRGRLEGGLQLYGSDWSSPGFVSVSRFNAGDLEHAVDPTDGGNAQRGILHGRYAASLGAVTSLETSLWLQAARSRVFLNVPGEDIQGQSEELDRRVGAGLETRLTWQRPAGEFTLGLSGRSDRADYDLYATDRRSRTDHDTDLDASYASASLYGRWRRVLAGRFGVDAGGRVDALRYASIDHLDPDADREHDTHAVASPKLGLRYSLGGGAAIFASASRGFRGAPGVIADPHRPLFLAWATEAGAELTRGPLDLRASAFRLHVDHERIQDPITREITDVGASVRRGLDLSGALRLFERWRVSGTITLNHARISGGAAAGGGADSATLAGGAALAGAGASIRGGPRLAHEGTLVPGDRVPAVSDYAGRVEIEGSFGRGLTAGATWRFTGPTTPIGEPDVRTRPYGVLDLTGGAPLFGSGPYLDVELQNALDREYPEIRASGFINPGAPRTLRAALRFDL